MSSKPTSKSSTELRERLQAGLQALDLSVSGEIVQALLDYVTLLDRWNRVYNLTSVREVAQMITVHLLDSLSVAPYLEGHRVLDVGTGAGLPGIPLALLRPDLEFSLLDGNRKKTRFIQQALLECRIKNVVVIQERIAEYHPVEGFDTVISRAYSALENYVRDIAHTLKPTSCILAMKGSYPAAELEQLPAGFRVEAVKPLRVPGLDAERHLVILRPQAE